ncbi:MAG: hypothetical protein IKN12_11840 [Selenomonadaceae bacterium]|nr:hypothetical protein [Selenomonadaceae bacterium]
MKRKWGKPQRHVRDSVNQENWKKFLAEFEKEYEKKSARATNSYGLSHK